MSGEAAHMSFHISEQGSHNFFLQFSCFFFIFLAAETHPNMLSRFLQFEADLRPAREIQKSHHPGQEISGDLNYCSGEKNAQTPEKSVGQAEKQKSLTERKKRPKNGAKEKKSKFFKTFLGENSTIFATPKR